MWRTWNRRTGKYERYVRITRREWVAHPESEDPPSVFKNRAMKRGGKRAARRGDTDPSKTL